MVLIQLYLDFGKDILIHCNINVDAFHQAVCFKIFWSKLRCWEYQIIVFPCLWVYVGITVWLGISKRCVEIMERLHGIVVMVWILSREDTGVIDWFSCHLVYFETWDLIRCAWNRTEVDPRLACKTSICLSFSGDFIRRLMWIPNDCRIQAMIL